MMKKSVIALSLVLLSGCADMGRVGLHPSLESAYFNGPPWQVESCLREAAYHQRLYLEQDDPLPGGAKRFNLEQDGDTVAWVEVDKSSHRQTSVSFFYNPKEPGIHAAISAMISACKTSR